MTALVKIYNPAKGSSFRCEGGESQCKGEPLTGILWHTLILSIKLSAVACLWRLPLEYMMNENIFKDVLIWLHKF